MTGSALGLGVAIFFFALYMLFLSRRSARGQMGRSGPGIRIAETTLCEHTWTVAQQVAAPIYQRLALSLAVVAAFTLALAAVNGVAALVVGAAGGLGSQVFLLGVASVRARKAAAAVQCEHTLAAKAKTKAPRTAPPHGSSRGNKRVTPKKPKR